MANPIIQRELVGLLRRPQVALMQIAFVAALTGLVLAVWPDTAEVNRSGQQAQQLFSVFVYGLLVAMMLLGPAMPAMAVVRERQQRTLTLLLTSPLTPANILIGKLSGALGFILLLLALSIPAAAACFVMGGIALEQLLLAYGVLALAAVQYATLALLVSAIVKGTDAALRVTYGLILVMSVIVLGPYYLLQGKVSGALMQLVGWVAALSPIPSVMQIVGHQSVGTRGLEAAADPMVQRYAVLAIITIAICVVGLLRRLQPHVTDKPRATGRITDEQTKGVRTFRRAMFLVDPNRRKGTIADYENPVMMKEFRTRTFGRAHWMIRIIGLCLLVSMGLMLVSTMGTMWISTAYMGGVLVVFQVGLIVLLTPALSAAVISSELESGGWVLLQMTALTPRRIITGKLLSVAWTLLLILLATLPGYGVLLTIDQGEASRVYNVIISLSLTAVSALLIGAACSSCFRRTAPATTVAYLLLIGLCVVTLLPWLGEGILFGRGVVETALIFNPLAAALSAMRMPGMADYNLIPANWWFLGAVSVIALAVLWIRVWQLNRPR